MSQRARIQVFRDDVPRAEVLRKFELILCATAEYMNRNDARRHHFNVVPVLEAKIFERSAPGSRSISILPERAGDAKLFIHSFADPIVSYVTVEIEGPTLDECLAWIAARGGPYADPFRTRICERVIDGLVYYLRHPTRVQRRLAEPPDYTQRLSEAYDFFHTRYHRGMSVPEFRRVERVLASLGGFLDDSADGYLLDLNPSNIVLEVDGVVERVLGAEYCERVRTAAGKEGVDFRQLMISWVCSGAFPELGFDQDWVMNAFADHAFFVDLDQINKRRVPTEDILMLLDMPHLGDAAALRDHLWQSFLAAHDAAFGKRRTDRLHRLRMVTAAFRNIRSAFHYLAGRTSSVIGKEIAAAGHLIRAGESISEAWNRRDEWMDDGATPAGLDVLAVWTLNFAELLRREAANEEPPFRRVQIDTFEGWASRDECGEIAGLLAAGEIDAARSRFRELRPRAESRDFLSVGQAFRDAERWTDAIEILEECADSTGPDWARWVALCEIGYCYRQLAVARTPEGMIYDEESRALHDKAVAYFERGLRGRLPSANIAAAVVNMLKSLLAVRDGDAMEAVFAWVDGNELVSNAITEAGAWGAVQECRNAHATIRLLGLSHSAGRRDPEPA